MTTLLPPSAFDLNASLANDDTDSVFAAHERAAPCETTKTSLVYKHDIYMKGDDIAVGSAAAAASSTVLISQLDKCRLQLQQEQQRCRSALGEVSSLKATHTSLLTSNNLAHDGQVRQLRGKHQREMEKLQSDFKAEQQKVQQQHEDLLRHRDGAIKTLQDDLSSLRIYFQRDVPAQQSQTSVRWDEERQHLQKELETTRQSYMQLQASFELLNIRQTAMSRIVALQERQVLKASADGPTINSSTRSDLLTLWREKVFALLIQLQLQESQAAREKAEIHQQAASFRTELESCIAAKQLLDSRLMESGASCKLTEQLNMTLQQELTTARKQIEQLQGDCAANSRCQAELRVVLESLGRHYAAFKENYVSSVEQMQSLQWRVEFATSRVAMVRDLRKLQPITCEQQSQAGNTRPEPEIADCAQPSKTLTGHPLSDHMGKELTTVRMERDQLVVKLRAQSVEFAKHLENQAEKAAGEKDDLRQKLDVATKQVLDLQKVHEAASADLVDAHGSVKQLTEALLDLRHIQGKEALLAQELQARQAEVSSLKKTLSEVQREHAKCAVAFQQASRELARQKDALKSRAAQEQSHLQRRVEQLEQRLQEAEREANMYMTALRQEGRLKNLKEGRRRPLIGLLQKPIAPASSDRPPRQSSALDIQHGRVEELGDDFSTAQSLEQLRQLSRAVLAEDA